VPIKGLLNPSNCMFLLVDYQPQMLFAVHSIDGQSLINNATGLAKTAKLFKIPTVLTTIAAKTFSGNTFPEVAHVLATKPLDRSSINCLQDKTVSSAVKKTGRKKIVIAGLWTTLCVGMPVIQALEEGYEVYFVVDACGDVSTVAHDMAVQRMIQAGAVPVTWLQVLLELQRDWAHKETYDAVLKICTEHAGAYGSGIRYAHDML
jgi:nicotinamidase-related amidase